MGCTTSTPLVDTCDEVLKKCRDRRLLIQKAMNHRQEFAMAHLAYIESLRNVGLALRRFAEGEICDVQSSPRTPGVPILALPQPSSSPVVGLPPLASSSSGSALSPPLSSPSILNLNPNTPSTPSLAIPASPPLPPLPLSTDRSPFSPSNPLSSVHNTDFPADIIGTPPPFSLHDMASPDRGSELSPPYYSPTRDDLDDALVAYSPPPPSFLPTDSSWFSFDTFTPPLIPYHLQEQRRMKQVGDLEDEERHAYDKVGEDEGMPELEDVQHKEDETGQDERDKMEETVSEEVVSEEKAGLSDTKIDENGSANDSMEKDQSVVVSTVQKEMVVAENDGKEKPKKELAVLTTLKERNLTEAVRHIDDQFARACKSGRDVSRMLETQMHCHLRISGFKDSPKVFNAITSHWSKKTSSVMRDAYEDNDVSECGMAGSHASTLERLYAWEKKLYDEVKAAELIRMAFDQKCKQLHNLDAKGGSPVVLDKMRATLKKLDTRLMVAIRAIHVASMRIQDLTNDELYHQLYELLGGLVSMWKMMLECHRAQQAIALEMQTLENLVAGDEASEAHQTATIELKQELEKWQSHFQHWIWSQKKYINELHKWLERCCEIKEPSKKGKKVTSDWTEGAPISRLLEEWRDSLVGLESWQKVVYGIRNFAAVIRSLEENQSDELKLKKQAKRSAKNLDQHTLSLNKLEEKYVEGRAHVTNHNLEMSGLTLKNKLQEERARLEEYRIRVDDEKHEHLAAVQGRKKTTLDLFKQHLPTMFEPMASFAEDVWRMYAKVQGKMEISDS